MHQFVAFVLSETTFLNIFPSKVFHLIHLQLSLWSALTLTRVGTALIADQASETQGAERIGHAETCRVGSQQCHDISLLSTHRVLSKCSHLIRGIWLNKITFSSSKWFFVTINTRRRARPVDFFTPHYSKACHHTASPISSPKNHLKCSWASSSSALCFLLNGNAWDVPVNSCVDWTGDRPRGPIYLPAQLR